jgi:hypothetical protein
VTDVTSTPQQPFSTGPDLSPDPVPGAASVVTAKNKSSRAVNLLLGLAVVVAIGGIAFAVGRATAPAATTAGNFPPGGGQFFNGGNGNGNGNGNGGTGNGLNQGGAGAFGAGGITVDGTVTAVNGDSMTIKTANGQEITVSTNGDTTYHQQAAATAGDVTTGSDVLVRLDGFRGRFGQGGPGASSAPSGAPQPTATDVTVVP